ncbi:MAG: site-specific integrase [Bacteroidetes bacterium]|nr:site-specific integrase [Bacteroidota bacterium]
MTPNYRVIAKAEGMTLAARKRANGKWTIFIDFSSERPRRLEYLGLQLIGKREQDAEANRMALAIFSRRIDEHRSRRLGLPAVSHANVRFVDYFKELAGQKNSKPWTNSCKYVERFFDERTTFADLTPSLIQSFQAFLLKHVSTNSAATYYDKFVAALNIAVRDDLIPASPAKKVKGIGRKDSDRTYLTIEELKQLNETPIGSPETKRAFLFACFTGLRWSDINSLTWDQIRDEQVTLRQGKTQDMVRIPLTTAATELLGERPAAGGRVFALLSDDHTNKNLKRWAAAAKISKHITFHVSRHTFATLALSYDVDIMTVRDLLGHKNLKNTMIYAKIIDKKRRDGMDKMPSL